MHSDPISAVRARLAPAGLTADPRPLPEGERQILRLRIDAWRRREPVSDREAVASEPMRKALSRLQDVPVEQRPSDLLRQRRRAVLRATGPSLPAAARSPALS